MLQVVLLLLLVVHATGQALPPTTADLASLAPAPTPLVCGAAGTLLGALPLASDFDYWVLRLFWPPALYATNVDGAAAAEAEAEAGRVGRGFWTHGLWNSETGGRPRAPPKPTPPGWERGSCANDALAAANFTPPLMAQLAGVQPGVPGNFSEATDLKFWSHEWNKHVSRVV
jgi:ribonuclease I